MPSLLSCQGEALLRWLNLSSASFRPTRSPSSGPCLRDEARLTQLAEKLQSINWNDSNGPSQDFQNRRRAQPDGRGIARTFVSRDYPQFRVDVEFKRAIQ